MEKQKRALVTVRKVDNVIKHPNADRLELCTIGGWTVITKINEFKKGNLGIFFEIDSFLPNLPKYEFLGTPKAYQGNLGHRLKTIKLRKQVSQGLLLPYSTFNMTVTVANDCFKSGCDLAEQLGVIKWELENAGHQTSKSGNAVGKFPEFIPKTDQERIQNMMHYFEIHKDTEFEETLKLDGSSMTAYKIDIELPWWKRAINTLLVHKKFEKLIFNDYYFGVCSRNLELKRTSWKSPSTFWKVAYQNDLEVKLPVGYAVQGELVGPGIQSNHEKMKNHEFYIYDIFDIKNQVYLTPAERKHMMTTHLTGIKHVPIPEPEFKLFAAISTFDELQKRVTGESMNPNTVSEGRVYKSLDGKTTFKAISNQYLLKDGN